MSYDIVYAKSFISTTRGIIPMVLIGSNNCYETKWDKRGRKLEVRERHWSVLNDVMIESTEGQNAWITAVSQGEADREVFMINSKWLYGKQVRGWFNRAVTQAHRLEEYLAWNPMVSFRCNFIAYADKKDFDRSVDDMAYCHDTAELEAWIDSAKIRRQEYMEENPNALIFLSMGFDTKEPLRSYKDIPGAVVAKSNGAYIKSYEITATGRSRSYTKDPDDAFVFDSVDHAIAELKITPNSYSAWDKVRFVKAETVKGKPALVIKACGGNYAGWYIWKVTARRIRFTKDTENAARYSSVASAKKCIQNIVNKSFMLGTKDFAICNLTECTEESYTAT